jgi:purine-nucleoside/S-methyl-5'-thioadenosine phosphorylase / adenosine deaminase
MAAFSIQTEHEVSFLTCVPMHTYGVVTHAFSTRLGGLSEPPYASLNLGLGSGDDRARVQENRARFGQSIGINPRDLVTLRQVHGNRVVVLTETTDPQLIQGTPGDGLITNRPFLPLAVITADCFPVVLAAPSVPAVGIIHSGRKGTAARVVPTAIELMSQAFDTPPEAQFVAIGPGIGRCCYEVDGASAEPFQTQFTLNDAVYRPGRPGHMYLDLQQAIVQQLREAGIPSTHVWHADLCTACHSHWFYSYRREGPRSGRMLNVVMIRSNVPPSSV